MDYGDTDCIAPTPPPIVRNLRNQADIESRKIDKTIDFAEAELPLVKDAMFSDQGTRLQWLEGEIAMTM